MSAFASPSSPLTAANLAALSSAPPTTSTSKHRHHPEKSSSSHRHSHSHGHSKHHRSGGANSGGGGGCLRRRCGGLFRFFLGSKRRIIATLAILLGLVLFAYMFIASNDFSVEEPFDESVVTGMMRERVTCADLEGRGGTKKLFGGITPLLTPNHVCDLSNVVVRSDQVIESYGMVHEILSLPIDLQHYHRRAYEEKEAIWKKRVARGEADDDTPSVSSESFTVALRKLFFGESMRHCWAYPYTPFGGRWTSCATTSRAVSFRDYRKRSGGREVRTAIFYAPHYDFTHPVHGLEPLGPMITTLERLVSSRKSDNSDSCRSVAAYEWLPRDKNGVPIRNTAMTQQQEQQLEIPISCIDDIDLVLVATANGKLKNTSLQFAALRAALVGAYRRADRPVADALKIPIESVSQKRIREPLDSAQRMVVPGALYDIFSYPHHGQIFRADLRQTISDHFAPPHQQKTPPVLHRTKRRIVYMARAADKQRRVVDENLFIPFLRRVAKQMQSELIVVHAGAMTSAELLAAIGSAQVMISIHGADLGNMLLLPPDRRTAVVELNPILFWEPRFFKLVEKMQDGDAKHRVSYFPWNCASTYCAFAGNLQKFHDSMIEAGVMWNETHDRRSPQTLELRSKARPGLAPAVWPWQGIVGEAHGGCGRPCLDIVGQSGLKRFFYTTFRASSIRVMTGQTPRQIAAVLSDAFAAVGWFDEAGDKKREEEKKQLMEALQVEFTAAEARGAAMHTMAPLSPWAKSLGLK